MYDFSVNYDAIVKSDLLNIHKYYTVMFELINHVFIGLLSFCIPLATKFVSLHNEACMVRYFLIDLHPIEIKYYLFMISLQKYNGSCNAVNDLSTNICVPNKTKHANVKVFNMITNKNETKAWV